MPYTLSLLDKSPIAPGQSAAEAVQATLRFAQRAEELDYHRFWVAEHHNVAELASSAPEILVAHLLSRTSRIRIGSGGVMLQHYSPYKVAEVFHLLSAIAPDRVDLGVGKAPGGLPLSTRALQWHLAEKPDFNAQFALLDDFLKQSLDKIHPLHGVRAEPVPEKGPQPFLLGASVDSARAAARRDWAFVYAGHLNADPAVLEATLSAYRTESGGRSPLLALAALAADSEEQAAKAVEGIKIFKVHLENGQSVSVGSPEQAVEFARQAGIANYRIEEKQPAILAGTAAGVRRQLDDLHERLGIDEFIIETPHVGEADRLHSIELLAKTRLSIAA